VGLTVKSDCRNEAPVLCVFVYTCMCVFRSIEELQEQNQKLLTVVRELSNDQEQRESENTDSKWAMHRLSTQFSSVQLQNLCFMQSYNKNYDGCADA